MKLRCLLRTFPYGHSSSAIRTVYTRMHTPEPVYGLHLPRVKQYLYVYPCCGEREWRDVVIAIDEEWGDVPVGGEV